MTRRLRSSISFAFLALALVAGAQLAQRALGGHRRAPAPPDGENGSVLATGRFDYRDDNGPGRVVAEVQVRLERRADGAAELVVVPSAIGALVDPIAGFRGVRGANHRTALELERLVAGGMVELVTHPKTGGEALHGTLPAERRGSLPERRLRPDGVIERRVPSAPVTLSLELASGALPPGEWTAEVVARGRPRLAVDFRFDAAGGEILDVRAMSEHTTTDEIQ